MDSVIFVIKLFVMLQVSILLHEVGHIVSLKRFRYKVRSLTLGVGPPFLTLPFGEFSLYLRVIPLGGKVVPVNMNFKPGPFFTVAISGIMFNLIGAIIGLVYYLSTQDQYGIVFLIVNVSLAALAWQDVRMAIDAYRLITKNKQS